MASFGGRGRVSDSPPPRFNEFTPNRSAERIADFSFDNTFKAALSPAGYQFESAGVKFQLYMRTDLDRETGAGWSRASLFRFDDEGKQVPVGFVDVSITRDPSGSVHAQCMKPVLVNKEGTANGGESGRELLEGAMDSIRKREDTYGYWIDPALSKAKLKGGSFVGIGRFLLSMQGWYAKQVRATTFSVCAPTELEYEILLHFYVDTVGAAACRDKANGVLLHVGLQNAVFPPPQIECEGPNPFGFKPMSKIDFKQLLGVQNPNFDLKIRAAGENWVLCVRSKDVELDETQKEDFNRIERVTVSMLHVNGSEFEPAGFFDRVNVYPMNHGKLPRAESFSDPIEGSDSWMENSSRLVDIADALRRDAPEDPDLGMRVPFNIAQQFSRHRGGKYSHIGRFMLAILDVHSQSQGVVDSIILVPKFPTRDSAVEYFRDFYANAGTSIFTVPGSAHLIRVAIAGAAFKPMEIVNVNPQMALTVDGSPVPPSS